MAPSLFDGDGKAAVDKLIAQYVPPQLINGEIKPLHIGILVVGLVLGYGAFWLLRAFYRLTLHPLAKFKGPTAAAVSTWWIYQQAKDGNPEKVFEKLHKEYNTKVIRIGPNELHITEKDLYNQIYAQNSPYLKNPPFYAAFNAQPGNVFTFKEPAKHRERRRLLNKNFSKQGIANLQPLLDKMIDQFMDILTGMDPRQPVWITNGVRALTTDVITSYCFGDPFGLLGISEKPTFINEFMETFEDQAHMLVEFRHWPILRWIVSSVPEPIMVKLSGSFRGFIGFRGYIERARQAYVAKRASLKNNLDHSLLLDAMDGHSESSIQSETIDLVVAGSDTTATTLATAIYNIGKNPQIENRLRAELDAALPDKNKRVRLSDIEQLPYLNAVIKEALRIAMPVPSRLPRIVPPTGPNGPLVVENKVVPPGTVIGMSAYHMHFDESIWGPDAREFNPDRWLADNAKELDSLYLVTFSKGGRQCIGINLAYAELRLTLSRLYRGLSFTLDPNITSKDLDQLDCFTYEYAGTGPRIFITGVRP